MKAFTGLVWLGVAALIALMVLSLANRLAHAEDAAQGTAVTTAGDTARETTDTRWNEARRLSDELRYDEALASLSEALVHDPDDIGLLWLQAGVAGWSGRHRESVALFEALIAGHPEMASDVSLDLAAQRLQAGDTDMALADLQTLLSTDPENSDAQMLRALALTYANRFQEAEEAYEEILATDPDHVKARMGLARVWNWRGQHRQAAALYEDLLSDGVDDPEVLNGLAHARFWSGRTDLAYSPLDELLARRPQHRGARELSRQLIWERRPTLSATYSSSDDSDDLNLRDTRIALRQPVSSRDVLRYQFHRIDADDPLRRFDLSSVGVGHERLWSDKLSTSVLFEYEYEGPGTVNHPLGDAYATLRPGTGLRLDLGVSRERLASSRSLERDILSTTAVTGIDWLVTPRWFLSAALRTHFFSDDNFAYRTSLHARYLTIQKTRFSLTSHLRFEQLASRDQVDNGYYSPGGYFELAPSVEATFESPSGFLLSAEAASGVQRENGSNAQFLGGVTARAEIPIANPVILGITGGATDSNLASDSGFSRSLWSVYLRGRF